MNKYLMEALDAYPFDLKQTLESLEYAISYDNECVQCYCLMGRLHADQLGEYDKAICYFEEAISRDINAAFVYPYYISTLFYQEQFEAAFKTIDFALTIKGSDKGRILFLKAICYEYQQLYQEALEAIKESEQHSFNSYFKNLLAEAKNRIKEKNAPGKDRKDKKNRKKKKKK
ncbi:MAG: hypothetical protein H6598_01720 [Flavobacteriales bacterium]|nr:hypothetical protein [Flavobacteriales bacterium]